MAEIGLVNVPVVLKRIADEIEKHGHFQDPDEVKITAGTRCCVMINPAYKVLDREVRVEVHKEIRKRAELGTYGSIVEWNDHTPTDQVLATLRGET